MHAAGPHAGAVGTRRRSRGARASRRRSAGSCSRSRARTCCRASGRTPTRPGGRLRCTARSSGGSALGDAVGAHAADEREPARARASGSRRSQSATTSSGVAVGPELHADRVAATPDRNSTCAPSSWRVRSPTHSRWAEQSYQSPVRLSLAGERLLVAEEQRLVRRVEVDLVELELRRRGRCRTRP